MKKRILSFFLILLICLGYSQHILAEVSQVSAIFENGVGSRSLGMGKAQIALFNEGYSLYWNPAGLSRVRSE